MQTSSKNNLNLDLLSEMPQQIPIVHNCYEQITDEKTAKIIERAREVAVIKANNINKKKFANKLGNAIGLKIKKIQDQCESDRTERNLKECKKNGDTKCF